MIAAERFRAVVNPPRYAGEQIIPWLKTQYRGNKPSGGLWTSTHTPGAAYLCDWEEGLARNLAIQRGVPEAERNAPGWLLTVQPSARVLHIESLAVARDFTLGYDLGRHPLPAELRAAPLGRLLTRCQTDWERATREHGAIHLSADAADEIAWAQAHEYADTAYATWNCESTLWGEWAFMAVEPAP